MFFIRKNKFHLFFLLMIISSIKVLSADEAQLRRDFDNINETIQTKRNHFKEIFDFFNAQNREDQSRLFSLPEAPTIYHFIEMNKLMIIIANDINNRTLDANATEEAKCKLSEQKKNAKKYLTEFEDLYLTGKSITRDIDGAQDILIQIKHYKEIAMKKEEAIKKEHLKAALEFFGFFNELDILLDNPQLQASKEDISKAYQGIIREQLSQNATQEEILVSQNKKRNAILHMNYIEENCPRFFSSWNQG